MPHKDYTTTGIYHSHERSRLYRLSGRRYPDIRRPVVCTSLGQQVAVLVNAGQVFITNAHANASKCFQCGNEAMDMKYTVRFYIQGKIIGRKEID